ncbi:MAG TPA: Cys-tRNA(Pro) deacylase [Candidatus Coprenecus merdigallinarum]|nr:Cys-tRNA(Pro) deacylase [Candidatus Coprenecus merdigallinarum]
MSKNESSKKTNAARLLDRAGITYELIPYEVDEEHLSADAVAAKLGEDIACVYKTIVLRGDRNGHFVCVVRGDSEIDLKEAARVSGNKRAELIHVKELLPLTGYIRGGCSPIGMKKPFPTYYQASIAELPYVYVSAGMRGLQLKIAPADLIAFTHGQLF